MAFTTLEAGTLRINFSFFTVELSHQTNILKSVPNDRSESIKGLYRNIVSTILCLRFLWFIANTVLRGVGYYSPLGIIYSDCYPCEGTKGVDDLTYTDR